MGPDREGGNLPVGWSEPQTSGEAAWGRSRELAITLPKAPLSPALLLCPAPCSSFLTSNAFSRQETACLKQNSRSPQVRPLSTGVLTLKSKRPVILDACSCTSKGLLCSVTHLHRFARAVASAQNRAPHPLFLHSSLSTQFTCQLPLLTIQPWRLLLRSLCSHGPCIYLSLFLKVTCLWTVCLSHS